MIHQPHGGTEGQATDIEISAKHIIKLRENLNKMLAENTGQLLSKDRKGRRARLLYGCERSKEIRHHGQDIVKSHTNRLCR